MVEFQLIGLGFLALFFGAIASGNHKSARR